MHIHCGMELDLEEIITLFFTRKHPQRMVLLDILSIAFIGEPNSCNISKLLSRESVVHQIFPTPYVH